MTRKADKRASLPRSSGTSTRHSSVVPRPLGTHRRTESTSIAPSPPATSKRTSTSLPSAGHHRSKSWLANLFKPTSVAEVPIEPDDPPRKEYGSLKLFDRTRTRTFPSCEGDGAKENRPALNAAPGFSKARANRPIRHLSVRNDAFSKGKQPERDLAKRLASWDWDGGERLDDACDTTLEIHARSTRDQDGNRQGDDEAIEMLADLEDGCFEAEQSLGTVWKGFLAETDDDKLDERSPTEELPPLGPSGPNTATMPNWLPSAKRKALPPLPDEALDDAEISFLSIADSSLADSTRSNFTLSAFPIPRSAVEISFTDPFSFASAASPSVRPAASLPVVPPPRPRRPSSRVSTTTLAERRFRVVPILKIDPTYPRKYSNASSTVSESVYSTHDDDVEQGLGSYFSPITPADVGDPSPFVSSFAITASGSTFPPPSPPLPDLALLATSRERNTSRGWLEPSVSSELDLSHVSDQSLALSTSTASSNNASTGRDSSLFDATYRNLPPSSTFTNTSFERLPLTSSILREERLGEMKDDTLKPQSFPSPTRVKGTWRPDWRLDAPQSTENGDASPRPAEDGAADDLSEEESLSEVEKRIEAFGRRELERRKSERKQRWRDERMALYGEPAEAEYEFGLAI
ncbi:hypothetical protein JCM10212_004414 [Sporobolomyces blumeae]